MKTLIRLLHTDTLSCEPILRRAPNGNLICVSQCGDVTEPAPGNRVYVFISQNNGETWDKPFKIIPETQEAVYCTEVMVLDGSIKAFLSIHNGGFLNIRCVVMESIDSGKTWINIGAPPFFDSFCFIRGMIHLQNGEIAIPYQKYPITKAENLRLLLLNQNITDFRFQRRIMDARINHVENGVLISKDKGKTFMKYKGPDISIQGDTGRMWAWTEPTLAQLSNGTLVMLLRVCRTGRLWRSESNDNGRSWSEVIPTDIPNPANKTKLISLEDGRIALIHTPNSRFGMANRWPLELWISDDNMRTFNDKRLLSDFPVSFCYPDGFYEDGKLLFTIEINRHDILFFDCQI